MDWELVGGKTRKNKQNGDTKSKNSKDDKMKLLAKAPKFDELKTATDTKFSVLDVEKPKEVETKKEKSVVPASSPKKLEKAKPKPPKTIEETLKQLNHHEFVTHMDNVKKRFANTPPEILLDELASYLNSSLVFEGAESSSFLEKPASYLPSCLAKETRKYLELLIRGQENRMLDKYFLVWIKGMSQDMAKNRPVNGYKLLLSMLIADKHSLDEDQLTTIAELCDVCKNQPKIVLPIFWAIGNAGRKDVKTGFNVWRLVMSNFLQYKHYSKWAVDYLTEHLSKVPEDINKSYLTEKDYFKLFDQLYPLEGKCSLSTQTQKTLVAEMPRIRKVAYGNKQESLRSYFLPYLERLNPAAEESVQTEILKELVQCLSSDTDCYKVWENQFKNYLDQSAILLEYLVEKHHFLPRNLIRPLVSRLHKECCDVIESFQEQQQSGSRFKKHKKFPEGYNRCLQVCRKLLDVSRPSGVKKGGSSLHKWNLTLLLLLVGVIYYDTSINGLGSFGDSKVGQFLQHSGLTERWNGFYDRSSAVLMETHRHLLEFYPVYYTPVRDAAASVWGVGAKGLHFVNTTASDIYVWFAENIPVAVDKIEDNFPGMKERVVKTYSHTSKFINHYATLGFDAAMPYCKVAFATVVQLLQAAKVHVGNAVEFIIPQLQHLAEWVKINVFRYNASWEELRDDILSALKILYIKAHESYHNLLHLLGLCSGH